MPQFTVVAGKLEVWDGEIERNYKYIESFDTREEAEAALKKCDGYHFAEIEESQD